MTTATVSYSEERTERGVRHRATVSFGDGSTARTRPYVTLSRAAAAAASLIAARGNA